MGGRDAAIGRRPRHGGRIGRCEFFCPAGKLKGDSVGILEIERPHVDTGMQRGRHLLLAFIVVEHRADPNALGLEALTILVELLRRTWNAKWFMVLTALVISPMPGMAAGDERPGTRSGASANQKNATQSPLPASKKKCCPSPSGRSSDLINGMPRTLL